MSSQWLECFVAITGFLNIYIIVFHIVWKQKSSNWVFG
jgi:hypothetical protein